MSRSAAWLWLESFLNGLPRLCSGQLNRILADYPRIAEHHQTCKLARGLMCCFFCKLLVGQVYRYSHVVRSRLAPGIREGPSERFRNNGPRSLKFYRVIAI